MLCTKCNGTGDMGFTTPQRCNRCSGSGRRKIDFKKLIADAKKLAEEIAREVDVYIDDEGWHWAKDVSLNDVLDPHRKLSTEELAESYRKVDVPDVVYTLSPVAFDRSEDISINECNCPHHKIPNNGETISLTHHNED